MPNQVTYIRASKVTNGLLQDLAYTKCGRLLSVIQLKGFTNRFYRDFCIPNEVYGGEVRRSTESDQYISSIQSPHSSHTAISRVEHDEKHGLSELLAQYTPRHRSLFYMLSAASADSLSFTSYIHHPRSGWTVSRPGFFV